MILEWSPRHPGVFALFSLALAGWTLTALAQWGLFRFWPIALIFVLLALIDGGLALWRASWLDRGAVLLLIIAGTALFLPPAQHIALSGDAAIYPNEAAYIARTGGVSGVYEPFTALSPEARDLFYIGADEQFGGVVQVQSYQGLLYGGYYLVDAPAAVLHTARMPLAEVWAGLLIKIAGLNAAFFLNPIAATLALIVLYAVGVEINGRGVALWGSLLLALSYPQVHFSRAPYAEVVGQLWMLAGLLLAVQWLRQRRPWQLALALFFWATTWSGRMDGLLLLGAASLLLLVAAHDRDRAGLRAGLLVLPVVVVLGWLATNAPYVGASVELFGLFWQIFLPAIFALLIGLPIALWLGWRYGQRFTAWHTRIAPITAGLLFAVCAFIVLWATLPHPLRTAEVVRPYQEIIWFSSQYVTPLFYWLTLAGVGVILLRPPRERVRLFLLAMFLGLAAIFFYKYSSAPVYPVSLRRLLADIFPLMTLIAGAALAAIPWRAGWRFARVGLAAISLAWIAWLAAPVVQQREAVDDAAFVAALHSALPVDGVFFFETQDADSWVGWLAAPLYSIYGDWALLLENDAPDSQLLAQAAREFEATTRPVYMISQHEPLPVSLLPAGYRAEPVSELRWRSSLIGQTRDPVYPPPYWEFEFPLFIYKLERE